MFYSVVVTSFDLSCCIALQGSCWEKPLAAHCRPSGARSQKGLGRGRKRVHSSPKALSITHLNCIAPHNISPLAQVYSKGFSVSLNSVVRDRLENLVLAYAQVNLTLLTDSSEIFTKSFGEFWPVPCSTHGGINIPRPGDSIGSEAG